MEKIYISNKVSNITNFGEKMVLTMLNGSKIVLSENVKLQILLLCNNGIEFNNLVEQIASMYSINIEKQKDIFDYIRKYIYKSQHSIMFEVDEKKSKRFNIITHSEKYAPDRLQFEITNNCNLFCRNCYKNANNKMNGTFLEINYFKEVLDALSFNLSEIGLTGGEPLLHPDFSNIVKLARKRCSTLEINTNGLLLYKIDKSVLNLLDKISISLYGINDDEYANNVGYELGFTDLKKGCKVLNQLDKPFNISVLIDKNNMMKMENYITTAINLGAQSLQCGTIDYIGRAKNNYKNKLDTQDLKQIYYNMRVLGKKYENQIKLLQWNRDVYSQNGRKNYLQLYKNICFLCSAGTLQWAVSERGRFRPCVTLPDSNSLSLSFEKWKQYINGEYKLDWKKYMNSLCEYCNHIGQKPQEYCDRIILK